MRKAHPLVNSTAHLDLNSRVFVYSPPEQAAPEEVKDDYRSNLFSGTRPRRVPGRVRGLFRTIRAARTSRPVCARATQQSATQERGTDRFVQQRRSTHPSGVSQQ